MLICLHQASTVHARNDYYDNSGLTFNEHMNFFLISLRSKSCGCAYLSRCFRRLMLWQSTECYNVLGNELVATSRV